MDQTDARPPRWPSVTLYGLGFAVNFLDTLGVGSFATTAATLKLGRLVDDERIPGTLSPNVTYRARWQGRGDWLGTATVAPQEIQFKSFGEARLVARSLGLRSEAEWRAYKSENGLPPGIPARPDHVYASSGWRGFRDWLRVPSV